MENPIVWQAVSLSLKVAIMALANVVVVGLVLARMMARRQFPWKTVLEAFLTLPLVLPPSVIGFLLLVLLGKHGPIGQLAEQLWHRPILFTTAAAVIAATVVAFPLFYQSVRAAFEGVDPRYEQAARILGAGEFKVFFTVTLPLAWPGVLAGLVMAFARALGEFGATLMVAGNIPGVSQTIPLAIYFTAEAGDYTTASFLVVVVSLVCLSIMVWLNCWTRHRVSKWQG